MLSPLNDGYLITTPLYNVFGMMAYKSVILQFYFLGKAISFSNVALLLSISDEFFSNKMFI